MITGSGIGAACARVFIAEGASVILADIDQSAGQLLAAKLGNKASFIACDVSSEEQVIALMTAIVARRSRLDCAVNNAGITGTPASIDNMKLEDWQQVLHVNLSSVFNCLKHELKQMQRQHAGAIVNVASGAGLIAVPNMAGYCASKHGVLGLSKTAATENVKNGIRVNAVLPGSVRTPMLEQTLALGAEVEKMIHASVPCGRFGTPAEIAQSIPGYATIAPHMSAARPCRSTTRRSAANMLRQRSFNTLLIASYSGDLAPLAVANSALRNRRPIAWQRMLKMPYSPFPLTSTTVPETGAATAS